MNKDNRYTLWFESLHYDDVPVVGGKNASLGEMTCALSQFGIKVPEGFAITVEAYWNYIKANGLKEKIRFQINEWENGSQSLERTGDSIRTLFLSSHFPESVTFEIRQAYNELCRRYKTAQVDVAVRSSATAEDSAEASFAGQQDTFLNISGEKELIEACRKCYASLFTDRAIIYRKEKGFDHMAMSISLGIQKMVRSDKAGSGVMFTLDTETGFTEVIVINAAWGLGESVVQGTVNPDEYHVFKTTLKSSGLKSIVEKILGVKDQKMIYSSGGDHTTESVNTSEFERRHFVLDDEEVITLAKWAQIIECHYQKPMDIEWAKDGESGELFIVQARPETIQIRKDETILKSYSLNEKGRVLFSGLAIGESITGGTVCVIRRPEDIAKFRDNSILVTEMTSPDWVPIMARSKAIITDNGGRTCHAAIVCRELGIPAVIGTRKATQVLLDNQEITLSCAEGSEGYVYDGILSYEENSIDLKHLPETHTKIMMNIASPSAASRWWRLPSSGIGLARMEFIINSLIKVHPMALVRFESLQDNAARMQIERMTEDYSDKTDYFVDHLSRGIAHIAASQYPLPVIVRMSDFKTNEYANLIGGRQFEPVEANPMLGFRGASRYYSDRYRDGFALECRAIKRAREEMGLNNIIIMIPFCRTLNEADKVIDELAKNGLRQGKDKLQVYMMCEIPSNVILAEEFARRFDGFSIGSNDLTQLVLGVDRDSGDLASLFDEQNEAVKITIENLIEKAHKVGRKVGICGQAPSDYPDFAAFLVRTGIDSISLNPDSLIKVKRHVAKIEEELRLKVYAKNL